MGVLPVRELWEHERVQLEELFMGWASDPAHEL